MKTSPAMRRRLPTLAVNGEMLVLISNLGIKDLWQQRILLYYVSKKTDSLLFSYCCQEIWWYVGQGGELAKETEVSEMTGVKVNDQDPDQDMVLALTGDDGPLSVGAMPRVGAVSEAGEKALFESLHSGTAAKQKQPRREKEEKNVEEMEPKTPKDQAVQMKDDVLKSATEARKYALSLKNLSYSGELVEGLMTHSSKMEKCFETINQLAGESSTPDERFTKVINYINRNTEWYKQAEVGPGSLKIVSNLCCFKSRQVFEIFVSQGT